MELRKLAVPLFAIILAALAYLQFRTWHGFDWRTFASISNHVQWGKVAAAIAMTYCAYLLRAVRWKVFLHPVKRVSAKSLVAAQFVGFTGLALLGRPGELVRPYLIARRYGLPVASQLAVWTVERICDVGAFAIILCVDIFLFGHDLPFARELRRLAFFAISLVLVLAAFAWAIRRHGSNLVDSLHRWRWMAELQSCRVVGDRLRSFSNGLNTIDSVTSFVKIAVLSLFMWCVVVVAYTLVLHAYPYPALQRITVPQVVLLIGCSMLGSVIQLPGVGGGSQLAMITMLAAQQWFGVPRELAVSSGMLVWLVAFVAVVPVGLALARREHLSLRRNIRDAQYGATAAI